MAYEDDDLFENDFEFVDEDSDLESEVDEDADADSAPSKSKKRPAANKERSKPSGKQSSAGSKAGADEENEPSELDESETNDGSKGGDNDKKDAAGAESKPDEPAGPPADHVVRIYEFGQLKRTLPRKFTDADAVAFAEEYSRTGKAYGRLAIPAHQDDPPAESFADAAKQ